MQILKKAEDAFVGITLLVATGLLFVNIILRYFFAANTTWAEEFIRYAMIWIAFIGSSICFRRGIHVGVDLLLNSLKAKGKRLLNVYINILAIIFMGFLVKFGVDLVMFSMSTGQITPSLKIKLYWIYLAIPLGAALSILHIAINTIQIIRNQNIKSERS
ncbi:TRAP transporter small permease [Sporosarcina sp. 179-K 8C2 HS]|uniref:TRAP transporter small permease n=1 Tax=Sporosarcina sp. 179-K 8C2 HS TaxID=3142387 RepID=UPI0039A01C86